MIGEPPRGAWKKEHPVTFVCAACARSIEVPQQYAPEKGAELFCFPCAVSKFGPLVYEPPAEEQRA